jgi:putative spermidine/putrescine transport system substrate-binding protein
MKIALLCGVALAALAISPAAAQERTLYLGSYGGSYETVLREQVLPKFEAEHDIKVSYVSGNSTETLAKLIAQKGKQEIDVVIMDDGPMYQAVGLGFCDTIKPGASYADVYDVAKMADKAVGIGFIATGIGYNTEEFEKRGWDPPSSWLDFADPKYKDLFLIPPANASTYGLNALVMYARLNGGSEDNIDPGFEYIKEKIVPNIRVFESSPGTVAQLFQTGEVIAGIYGGGRILAMAEAGAPLKFVYPKEGATVIVSATCPVVGSDLPEESQALVNYLISPDVQKIIAAGMGLGPVNKTVELSDELAAKVPYGADTVEKFYAVDWTKVNPQREEWSKRWTREIER